MASIIYNSFLFDAMTGVIDVDTDTFKAMLVTSTYTPSKAHDKRNDITNEITGTGYTAGGQAVVPTITKSDVTNNVIITIPQLIWTSSTLTARGMPVYKSRGGAASADELVCFIDFLQDIVTVNQSFIALQSTLTLQN
jgi:hypothetical protein